MSRQTRAAIVAVPHIPSREREAMLALHQRYYDNVRREIFLRDLAEKKWAIVLRDAAGTLAGFSTLQIVVLDVDGATHRFLFSGDTVVDERHRTSPALAGSFGHVLLRLMDDFGESNLHWFLISKGYRTYRFLPVFFREFFPVYNRSTPPGVARLLDAVARRKFGSRYDAGAGVIRMGSEGDWLNERAAFIPEHRRGDPHVKFFLERNPGWAHGDELACLADITRANLNRFAWRVIRETQVTWDE